MISEALPILRLFANKKLKCMKQEGEKWIRHDSNKVEKEIEKRIYGFPAKPLP